MISFVGAGPGAADLITIRGQNRIARADIVIWASSLVPKSLLDHCQSNPVIYDSAGMTLEDVISIYEKNPHSNIVRLHSGDPSIYGAIQEQINWSLENNRTFEVVPGVTSLSATAAAIGRELTIPGVSQSIISTRLASRTSSSMPKKESITKFSSHGTTMAIFLSASKPKLLQEQLLDISSNYNEQTPAVIGIRISWPDEQIIWTTVGQLAKDIIKTKIKTTVIVLVGPALKETGKRSNLYSPTFAHGFRKKSLVGSTKSRPSKKE